MESFLIAGAFFLMVFTPALVGSRNAARENRLAAGEQPRRRFRIPSLSASMSNIRSRSRAAAPVAVEDPLQALALEIADAIGPVPVAPMAAVVAAQPPAYVKNFAFDVSRFNQPERRHEEIPIQIAAVPYAQAELALRAVAAEPLAERAISPEAAAEEASVSYGDPEPLYVRRAVYGQRLPRFAAQPQEHAHDEMVPYPYAPPFAYPAQPGPYMAPHPMLGPMAGQVMPPMPQGYPQMPQGYPQMPQGYPQMPQAGMGMPFPNPYLYPMAFMPMYPMGFYPMPMPGPGYGQGYPGQQQQMGPMGPQLVEPQPGYGNQGRWEHRSATPRRSPFRRA